jgi:hypothetical protein
MPDMDDVYDTDAKNVCDIKRVKSAAQFIQLLHG